MKKQIAAAITSMFLIFAQPTFAESIQADQTLEYQQHQIFEINGDSSMRFEIEPPELAHIISNDNGNAKFAFDGSGDVYIRCIYPNDDEYVFRLIVSGSSNETVEELAEEVLELVNIERAKVGVAPLILSDELMWASNIRAEELIQSFSHTRPDGSVCSSLIEDGMYTVGENIAAGNSTAKQTVEQWMNSPGHRANILNSDYTELGVGYFYDANSQYGHYWVQMFKRPMPR